MNKTMTSAIFGIMVFVIMSMALVAAAPIKDKIKPTITISSPANGAKIYASTTPVSGNVYDAGIVKQVTIRCVESGDNGVVFSNSQNVKFYLQKLKLVLGKNTIRVVAWDKAGNQGIKEIAVYRMK